MHTAIKTAAVWIALASVTSAILACYLNKIGCDKEASKILKWISVPLAVLLLALTITA